MKKAKTVLSLSVALCLLLTCTACGGESGVATAGVDVQAKPQNEIVLQTTAVEEIEADKIIDGPIMTEPMTLTKDQLYYRCHNTLEYMDQLSANVSVLLGGDYPNIYTGIIQHDYENDIYYTISDTITRETNTNVQTIETFNDGCVCVSLADNTRNERENVSDMFGGFSMRNVNIANACPVNPKDTVAVAAAGENAVTSVSQLDEMELYGTFACDPSGDHTLGAFYIPQEMSRGYLQHFEYWDIVGTEMVQGRNCAVVEGVAPPDYGSRYLVETFKIKVDQETGVWMWFEGYDADGNVQAYVYTENVKFGADADAVTPFTADSVDTELFSDFDYAEYETLQEEAAVLK